MMRKILALLLSAVLALLLLTSCYTLEIEVVDENQTTTKAESNKSETKSENSKNESSASKKGVSWDGTVADSYESGSGTSEDPYEIATAEQLALLAQQTNEGKVKSGMYFYLSSDIYLNSADDIELMREIVSEAYNEYIQNRGKLKEEAVQLATGEEASYMLYPIDDNYNFNYWTPIGYIVYSFEGNFDGKGYTIYGICSVEGNLFASFGYNGLFGKIEEGAISNVNVDTAIVIGPTSIEEEICSCFCGGLVGDAQNGTIENCSVDNVFVEGYWAGAVTGVIGGDEEANMKITNCSTHSNSYVVGVSETRPSGGIAGLVTDYCNIKFCCNYGFSDCGIAGLLSGNSIEISYCVNLGESSEYAICYTNVDLDIVACYHSDSSSVDGSNITSSGISATSESNLRSFDWLVENLGISDSIWGMSNGELYLK